MTVQLPWANGAEDAETDPGCRKCVVQSWPGQRLAKSEGSKEHDSSNKTQSLGGVNYKASLGGDLDPSELGLGF